MEYLVEGRLRVAGICLADAIGVIWWFLMIPGGWILHDEFGSGIR